MRYIFIDEETFPFSRRRQGNTKIIHKRNVVGIGILFFVIGLGCLSSTATAKTWVYAHVDCSIVGVPPDVVTWGYASPQNSFIKWFVVNLDFTTAKGNGSIIIKPIARPVITYDFPGDFTSLKIKCIYNHLGGIVFTPGVGDEYNFLCRGHGLFVEVN